MTTTPKNTDWRQLIQRVIKAEMSKRDVKYQDLSDRLHSIGVSQSADNLRNKINKGILGADLFWQIMMVLNVQQIERRELLEIFSEMNVQLDSL